MSIEQLGLVLAERGVDVEVLLSDIVEATGSAVPEREAALLTEGGVNVSNVTPADVAAMYESAAVFDARFLAETYTAGQVADLLRIRPESVRNYAANKRLISLKDGRARRYPSVQFRAGRRMPHTETIIAAAPGFWSVVDLVGFLSTPQPGLTAGSAPVSPADWLFAGRSVESVVAEMDWDS